MINSFARDTPSSASIQSIFSAAPPITAILATDAIRADLVAQAAKAAGLSIPRDMSIVDFDSINTKSEYSGWSIDPEAIGRRSMELLALPKHPCQHVRMPATWSEGRTIAPPASG